MNLVGLENITPYQGVYEFKLYEYDYGQLDLNNKDLFVGDLKVVINRVEPIYKDKIDKQMEVLAIIKNLKVDKTTIQEEIKDFILNEIYEENLEKENIDLMFIES